jgi:hypothetical protein
MEEAMRVTLSLVALSLLCFSPANAEVVILGVYENSSQATSPSSEMVMVDTANERTWRCVGNFALPNPSVMCSPAIGLEARPQPPKPARWSFATQWAGVGAPEVRPPLRLHLATYWAVDQENGLVMYCLIGGYDNYQAPSPARTLCKSFQIP